LYCLFAMTFPTQTTIKNINNAVAILPYRYNGLYLKGKYINTFKQKGLRCLVAWLHCGSQRAKNS